MPLIRTLVLLPTVQAGRISYQVLIFMVTSRNFFQNCFCLVYRMPSRDFKDNNSHLLYLMKPFPIKVLHRFLLKTQISEIQVSQILKVSEIQNRYFKPGQF